MHKRILIRLDRPNSVDSVDDLNLTGFDFHGLRGFAPKRFSIHVNGPWCITFEFSGANPGFACKRPMMRGTPSAPLRSFVNGKKRFANAWDAIEKTPAQAENMKLPSVLMMALKDHIAREISGSQNASCDIDGSARQAIPSRWHSGGLKAEVLLGAARIFASHYQIVVCDDPWRSLADEENWTSEKTLQDFAGSPCFRMVGTEADRNDHWIELYASDRPPLLDEWQRVTCVHFRCTTGKVHVMSVIDQEAPSLQTFRKEIMQSMSRDRTSGSIYATRVKRHASPMKRLPREKTWNGTASSWFPAFQAALGGLGTT